MDNCFSKYYSSYGSLFYTVIRLSAFKKIEKEIKQKIFSLNNENDKDEFRKGCLNLADYLIANNNPPKHYEDYKITWKGALNNKLNGYYKQLRKHGGCPLILDDIDKKILELKYEEINFCDKKKIDFNEIKQLKRDPKNYDTYISKCNAYNKWIEEKKNYFKEKETLFGKCYKTKDQKKKKIESSETICDLMKPETFQELSECPSLHELSASKTASEKENIDPQTKADEITMDSNTSQDPQDQLEISQSFETTENVHVSKDEQETQQELQSPPSPDVHVKVQIPASESSSIESEATSTNGIQVNAPQYFIDHDYTLIGGFKKKKRIKRKQAKFLRILLPSFSNEKKKFLAQHYTEQSIYDDEEIIKKLKIHEHDMIKYVNTPKQKKDRFKTIIEVHMEVLKELRNEEWEYKKREFLEICIELLAKKEHRTYVGLNNEEPMMENTKIINDFEKQQILWNKWVKEHKNISEKLKKTDWFNYLKNEWKKEKDSIKKYKEFKMNISNEIQKGSFSEKEKDLWKDWILKKRIHIEQYLEQEWFEGLTQELLNMLDECVNEDTKYNISILNMEELHKKENYEELYNYIKKKLLEKLCILVFAMVLEECKKEDFIENEESHLDSSINDWKTEVNLERKSDIIKKINDINDDFLENKENRKIYTYMGNKCFRKQIEDWIREHNTPSNSIYNESSVE
ncbi:STP1 protein [Plasmodium malariae]|uniref:STP1 protein n=1 Tax=Plasmodium malariae TaxID=5858 RepID=A0A1D3JH75_PLAMA|nr:STP1 protein [Plasmodium malariae]SBT85669.1 STP1 protein [Plasmodium malariae]